VISQKKLVHFVRSKQPMIAWNLIKMLGIVYLRYLMRRYCLPPRCGKFLPGTEYFFLDANLACKSCSGRLTREKFYTAYPGDKDWRVAGRFSSCSLEARGIRFGTKI
jgi:hypothetical protein